MRGWVAAALVLLALPVAVQTAAGSGPSMTVAASPRTARAHGVRLTFTLRYEMRDQLAKPEPVVLAEALDYRKMARPNG